MHKTSLSRGLLVTVAALVAFSPNLNAAEWAAEPSISLRQGYNDNIRLTTIDDHEATWTTTLDPRLRLSRHTELWDLSASARVRAQANQGGNGLGNSVDNFIDLASKRRFERGSWEASASQVDDTTLQDEELDLDTGLTTSQIDRTRRSFQLSANYMFTETTWLEGSVGYSKVEYDQDAFVGSGSTDYDTLTPSLTIIHQLNPRTQIFSVYNHSITNYDNSRNTESTTDSLMLGAEYNFTETWRLNGSVGRRRTQTSQTVTTPVPRPGFLLFYPFIFDVVSATDESTSTGLVYNLNLTREFETGSLSLSGSRSVSPSSNGTSSESTSFTLRGDHKFSPKLSGNLAVSYLQSSQLGATNSTLDRDSYRISPNMTWQLDRDLQMNAGYAYTRVDKDSAGNVTADSNAVYLSLNYKWPRIAVSR